MNGATHEVQRITFSSVSLGRCSWNEALTVDGSCLFRTPTFCASLPSAVSNREFQCSRSDAFGLVVHGLWPQTAGASSVREQPRNCRNDDQLPSSVIRRYYCLMPDEDLMQAEWEKHGSCYFKSAREYFAAIESLFLRLNVPNIRAMTHPSAASVKNGFLQLNAPQLFSSAISVKMNSQGQLEEIHLCYDLQYRFISCAQR